MAFCISDPSSVLVPIGSLADKSEPRDDRGYDMKKAIQ